MNAATRLCCPKRSAWWRNVPNHAYAAPPWAKRRRPPRGAPANRAGTTHRGGHAPRSCPAATRNGFARRPAPTGRCPPRAAAYVFRNPRPPRTRTPAHTRRATRARPAKDGGTRHTTTPMDCAGRQADSRTYGDAPSARSPVARNPRAHAARAGRRASRRSRPRGPSPWRTRESSSLSSDWSAQHGTTAYRLRPSGHRGPAR
ncbi:Uncharacterised protein [Bordetella pertussis]|nr:Uncharacterised protein [Bordetella pertussis]